MPTRIVTQQHRWVIAATIPVDEKTAKRGVDRLSVRTSMLPADLKIDALEVYCSQCRKNYDDCADRPCEAAQSNDHLIGGPTGERKKRTHYYHDCDALGCPLEVRRYAG